MTQLAHWYNEQGSPVHEIEKKDGSGMRPTDARDAKKLNLRPSVTTILKNTIYNYALEQWKINNAIMAALTLPKLPDEGLDAYYDRVKADAEEEGKKARKMGTDIHDCIEQYLCTGSYVSFDDKVIAFANPAIKWIEEHKFVGEAEKVRVSATHAGRIDYEGSFDFDGKHYPKAILDFKTRNSKAGERFGLYETDLYQLGGYLDLNGDMDTVIGNVLISSTEVGRIELVLYDKAKIEKALKVFRKACELFREMKGML